MLRLKYLALAITILPLVSIHLSYFVSSSQQLVPACIPYIEGCTSISRAGRNGDAIFVFRVGMMVSAVLMAFFWWCQAYIIKQTFYNQPYMPWIIGTLGVIGAAFMLLYVDYLGFEGDFYRKMRRLGIVIFFTFTYIAQLLTLRQHLLKTDVSRRPLYFQLLCCALVLVVGLASLALEQTELKTFETENIAEWNAVLFLSLYFVGSYFLLKHKYLSLQ